MPTRERKEQYFAKLVDLMETCSQLFLVHADNVGSNQMARVRIGLRGKATVVMGKNTLIRRCMLNWLENNPESGYANLLPYIKGNVGLVFCNGKGVGMGEIKSIIEKFVVPAPAKAGTLANVNVWVPDGPTGCDPSQTAYFQALNVATKIAKGQIEIVSPVMVCAAGDRVTPGAASLCQTMGIKPFTFGLQIQQVYDNGSVYSPKVLDLSPADLAAKFCQGVRNVAAVSLVLGYPTLASLPHSLSNALKHCIALLSGAKSTYSFPKAEEVLGIMAMDPEARAALAAASAAAGGGGGAAEEEKKEEEEPEEEAVAVGNMFGDDAEADGGW